MKAIGLSVDSVEGHQAWLGEPDRTVADLDDMIHPNADDTLIYPASTGRNFDEILRVIDLLQLTDDTIATPVQWQQGDDVSIVPAEHRRDRRAVPRRLGRRVALPAGGRPPT